MNDTKIAELFLLCKELGFEAPEAYIGSCTPKTFELADTFNEPITGKLK